MGKWLAKFSAENQELQPDSPDILASVSDLSDPFPISDEESSPQALSQWPLLVGDSVIEPAAAPQAKPVYWEKADTSIWGPATPLFLERSNQDYVLVVEYLGELISVNANVLRSREAFETQGRKSE